MGHRIGIELYLQSFMSDYMKQKEDSLKRCRLVETFVFTFVIPQSPRWHTKIFFVDRQKLRLLAVLARDMWPRGASCGWAWALSRNSCYNARAWMLRDEEIMMPGSKEASFFRRFYRIPFVSFLLFGCERGLLIHYCVLENCGAAASTTVSALACVDYIETNPTTH